MSDELYPAVLRAISFKDRTDQGMTWHVRAAAHQRDPHIAPTNLCPVCSLELPAGHGRHPTCDPRWLQPASSATGSDTSAEANRTDER